MKTTFDPHCSFFIAAAWPMFVMALLVSKEIMPSVFMQKARYPIYTIFVVGIGNLLSLLIWHYYLKRDGMEYGRFVLAGVITAILGIAIFGPMHHYKDAAMWWRYVATVFITYQIVFPLIYISEKWVCQGNYVKHIVV
jgi:hypothetical protein